VSSTSLKLARAARTPAVGCRHDSRARPGPYPRRPPQRRLLGPHCRDPRGAGARAGRDHRAGRRGGRELHRRLPAPGHLPPDHAVRPRVRGAGTVERVGEGAAHSPGDRVAWGQHRGSAAGLVTLPASAVVSVPAGLELDIAAAAMLQGLTAHYLVNSTYAVQPGDTVLAQPWPAEWVSCSSSSSRPRARPSSARRHGREGGQGDSARRGPRHQLHRGRRPRGSGPRADRGYRCPCRLRRRRHVDLRRLPRRLRPRGTLVLFGAASGQVPPFDIQRLNAGGSLSVTRPALANYIATRDELEWRAAEILGVLADADVG